MHPPTNTLIYGFLNTFLYECLFCRIYSDVDYGEFALIMATQMLGRLTLDTYINEISGKTYIMSNSWILKSYVKDGSYNDSFFFIHCHYQ